MKNRELYMSKILPFMDKEQIKVITGIRRSGKSMMLHLIMRHLKERGVPDERIIYMNFESVFADEFRDYKALHKYVMDRTSKTERTYILLDEIQEVPSWERSINSFRVDCDCDIYITGSNAYLLNSELSTLLAGRYVTIMMFPLSFKEYLDFSNFDTSRSDYTQATMDIFQEYIKYGGMPNITSLDKTEQVIGTALTNVYDTAMMKDVVSRNSIKDIALLETVTRFVVSNIGNITTPKKISDYLNSDGRKTTSETIDNYLKMLENAFILYRAKRFDLKGKQHLKTLHKYYIIDTGIRNALLGFKDADYGHILENIVYFELLRRNREVSIGKYNGYEVDFVTESFDDRKYYQVAATILDETTAQRELRSLEAINDNYEKTILTMDRNFIKSRNGIKIVNIIDFLLQPYF